MCSHIWKRKEKGLYECILCKFIRKIEDLYFADLCKIVSNLTAKFPNLSEEEVEELSILSNNLKVQSENALHDWNKWY